jgi:hypothetical protein
LLLPPGLFAAVRRSWKKKPLGGTSSLQMSRNYQQQKLPRFCNIWNEWKSEAGVTRKEARSSDNGPS